MIFEQKREETKPTRLISVSESVSFREFVLTFSDCGHHGATTESVSATTEPGNSIAHLASVRCSRIKPRSSKATVTMVRVMITLIVESLVSVVSAVSALMVR